MSKNENFSILMDLISDFSKLSSRYQNIPRVYGVDEPLYMAEAHLIQHIGDLQVSTVTELAKIDQKSKSAISQMITKLVQKNLVEKTKTESNKKQILISLTEKGNIVYNYHSKLDETNYSRYLSKLESFNNDDILKTAELFKVLISEFTDELQNIK